MSIPRSRLEQIRANLELTRDTLRREVNVLAGTADGCERRLAASGESVTITDYVNVQLAQTRDRLDDAQEALKAVDAALLQMVGRGAR